MTFDGDLVPKLNGERYQADAEIVGGDAVEHADCAPGGHVDSNDASRAGFAFRDHGNG